MSHPVMIFPEHWSTQKRILMAAAGLKEQLVEYTASGNPLSFNTNIAKPLKSLLIPWTPTQDSGDPSPSSPKPISGVSGLTVWRTGKNLFDIDDLWDNGTNRGSGEVNRSIKLTVPNGKYTVSTNAPNNTNPAVASVFVTNELVTPTSGYDGVFLNTPKTITVTNGELYIYIRVGSSGGYLTWDKTSFADYYIQCEIGEQASEYSPYTGTTIPVTFPALTKNLFDADIEQGSFLPGTGEPQSSTTRVRSGYVKLSAGTYTISNAENRQTVLYYYDAEKTYVRDKSFTSWQDSPFTFTLTETAYIRFAWRKGTSNPEMVVADISGIMLNTGETALPYEPYTNTVYGGSLDLTTGVMTVDMATLDISTLTWEYGAGDGSVWHAIESTSFKPTAADVKANAYCDKLLVSAYNSFSNTLQNDLRIAIDTNGRPRLRYNAFTSEDVNDLKAFLATMTFMAELNEPQTIQLSATEITALVGDNVIWTDTNGSNTAVYLKRG